MSESKLCNETEINVVTVRWYDGYKEKFSCVTVRFGSDFLWLKLVDGSNRWIPLRQVRCISTSIDSKLENQM